MYLRLSLYTLVLIAGVAGVLIGGIVIATGMHPVPGWTALLIGLPVAVLAGLQIARINRAYQDHHLAEVLRDPTEIVARWHDGAQEVILARRGLFLGRSFLPFAAGYQRLLHMHLSSDERTLHLEFDTLGVDGSLTREVAVAAAAVAAVRAHLAGPGA